MTDTKPMAAVNRFGLGARPGDLQKVRDARGWLEAQKWNVREAANGQIVL